MSMEFQDLDPEDRPAMNRAAAEAEYATVVLTLGRAPDDPGQLATTLITHPGVPCYLAVSEALLDIALEFERRHHYRCC